MIRYFSDHIVAHVAQDGGVSVTFDASASANLELILKRALNTLPEGPRELFELSDFLASLNNPSTSHTSPKG